MAKLRRHPAFDERPAHGGGIGLKLGQFLGIFRGQGVRNRGQNLGNLHQRALEAAQGLARRVLTESPEPSEVTSGEPLDRARLDRAFRACTSRHACTEELDALAAYLADERMRLAAEPDRTADLCASEVLPTPVDLGIDPVELAAWTLVGSALLNLDEVLTRR